jgi:hypothetical protein
LAAGEEQILRCAQDDSICQIECRLCGLVVEFLPEGGEGEFDGGAGDGEGRLLRLVEAVGVGEVSAAGVGVNEPDVLDAEAEVVGDALLEAGEGVFGGEDLDDEQGWGAEDVLAWCVFPNNGDVGDAEAGGGYLHAVFGEDFRLPELCIDSEEDREKALHLGMFNLAQVSLLDLAINIVAIRTIAGVQVFLDRDEDGIWQGISPGVAAQNRTHRVVSRIEARRPSRYKGCWGPA